MAIEYGMTGPILRASGIPYDLRRHAPYLCYPDLDFDVICHDEGDCWARYKVRMDEMRQSYRIVQQALERMPPGPVNVTSNKVALPSKAEVYSSMEALIHHFKLIMQQHGIQMPVNEYYSATEVPNGELGFYIVSDGSGRPYKVHWRSPSLMAYQIYGKLLEGVMISDAIAVLSSLNVIAGELDR
jgi:NADH-quinone oxidoreductase subunit D